MSQLDWRSSHDGSQWSHVVTVAGEKILRLKGFKRRSQRTTTGLMDVLEGRGRGGPDLLFLHGLGDRNSTWHRVLLRLAKGPYGRIIAPDLTGFGRSRLAPGRPMPTMDVGLADMHRFVQAAFPKPPVVIGNSLGGWLSWRFLTAYPEAVRGALLLAPAGFMTPEDLRSLMGRFIDGDREIMARAIMGDARPEVLWVARRIVGHMMRCEIIAELCQQPAEPYLYRPGELDDVKHRMRVVWGDVDTLMPEVGWQMVSQIFGGSAYRERVGHAPQQTRPKMVIRHLDALIAELDLSR